MSFFESLLALLLAAVILLQISRRLSLPYPAMLAAAGVVLALVPGAPNILIDPETALALFIAPALLDAAFDFPIGAARRFWQPLVIFAIVAVLITTALVAWIGWAFGGLPIAAAVALGAIVAPPDAAAATAVLNAVSIPRNTEAILKGESLFNDATALLLLSGALTIQSHGGFDPGVGWRLLLAAPGGVLFGLACAWVVRRINRFVTGTLGGNLLQFVNTFVVWVVAQHLQLSAILAVVALAMRLASNVELSRSARMRVHSYAVWGSVVFVLNVFAFLLMGLQARTIVAQMQGTRLRDAFVFAGTVIAAVILVRLLVVVGYNRLISYRRRRRGEAEPASIQQGILVGWSGMRGLVTLATAFALPASFPQRDLIVLTAFGVVLATLVVQGLTLAPLIRLLGLDQRAASVSERSSARLGLAQAALAAIAGETGAEAEHVRYAYQLEARAAGESADIERDTGLSRRRRELGLAAVAAERERLEEMRAQHQISDRTYGLLQEEMDWRELLLLPEDERRIEES